ncbi:hypothetical protein LJC69_05370 [Bacteroidales bacterium OttesenSCG-928-K22]|nr:hypothetical protein [Bacteroidales bacterium OttesenSCG-928-K22]
MMTRKEIFKLIFVNPFEKIAGWQALGLGLIFMILTAVVGSCNGSYYDGALDMHASGKAYPLWIAFAMLGIDLASIIIMFLIAGLIFSRNFRVVDVIGTTVLAKAPTLLLGISGFVPAPDFVETLTENPEAFINNPNMIFSSVSFIVVAILMIPVLVWTIALFYNAFKVSLNIRKNNTIIFILAVIFAEVISKILINYII